MLQAWEGGGAYFLLFYLFLRPGFSGVTFFVFLGRGVRWVCGKDFSQCKHNASIWILLQLVQIELHIYVFKTYKHSIQLVSQIVQLVLKTHKHDGGQWHHPLKRAQMIYSDALPCRQI